VTLPRRVLPDTSYLLSRRCLDRRFYLRPSPALNDIYLYALAHAQQKHGVAVHAFACMSDHCHESVTDADGVLPDFMRDFRRELALGAKVLYQIPENVWAAQKPSAVELHGDGAALEKALYTILNPVQAGLVAHAAEWPGAISLPGIREIEVRRPEIWFGDDRPEVLTLKITPPPAWKGTEDEWHEWLAENVAEREEEIRRERAGRGVGVLGKQRILQQSPFDRPRNPDETVPGVHPTVATAGDGKLMKSLVGMLRAWRQAYVDARELWRVNKATLFPLGTWWVVKRAGAAVA
jgi:putative transposase